MTTQPKNQDRSFIGKVVSDKMKKTIVVVVERKKVHPKYNKQYILSTKFKVHDENDLAKVGNEVEFVECRPISKDKKWRLVKVIK